MRTFEYHTSFIPIRYDGGRGLFSSPPQVPEVDAFLTDPAYLEHLSEMGAKGWELVGAQPLLRGIEAGTAGYALTAGYFLFWKRETTEVQ